MSASCEIIVKGHLDADWSDWLEGLTITHNERGETVISGRIRDQAALFGVFAKLRDLALFLLSVKYVADESFQELHDSDEAAPVP